MRVMLIAPSSEIHSERFLKWLQKAGCEAFVVDTTKPLASNPSPSYFIDYPSNLRTEIVRVLGDSPRLLKSLRRLLAELAPILPGRFRRGVGLWLRTNIDEYWRPFRLRRIWRQIRPDIVHVHWADLWAYDCYKARLQPLVLTCWGSDINRFFDARIDRLYPVSDPAFAKRVGLGLAWADFVFADSRQVLERCTLLARRTVPSMRLYLGIDTARFHPGDADAGRMWREKLHIPKGAKVLLSVRALKREHRHEVILRAFAVARRSLSFPVFLVLKRYNILDRSYEQELRTEAERLGVTLYLRWLDRVPYESMPGIYSMADVVVNFPVVDGFPVSFIEAASCGKRVISNRLPAYEGTGLENIIRTVFPDTVQELANAMIEVLQEATDVALAECQRARKWACEFGDERACIRVLLETYESIIKRR